MELRERKKLLGKTFNHSIFGVVKVVELVDKSYSSVLVEIVDKGDGWDERSKSFKGVKISGKDKDGNRVNGWMRGDNRDNGEVVKVRIDNLKSKSYE